MPVTVELRGWIEVLHLTTRIQRCFHGLIDDVNVRAGFYLTGWADGLVFEQEFAAGASAARL
jgi:hypothetical protein